MPEKKGRSYYGCFPTLSVDITQFPMILRPTDQIRLVGLFFMPTEISDRQRNSVGFITEKKIFERSVYFFAFNVAVQE